MASEHRYRVRTEWSGARQGPTSSYGAYSREFTVACEGKPALTGSADITFRGDPALYNPEELLVIALSSCHLLSYLALCARAGISVVSYQDEASGKMAIDGGRMRFVEVALRPQVVVAQGADIEKARALHEKAHEECFIANSVSFPVRHEAAITQQAL